MIPHRLNHLVDEALVRLEGKIAKGVQDLVVVAFREGTLQIQRETNIRIAHFTLSQ